MEQILNVNQMKMADQVTIKEHQVPSLVLIENAANSVVSFVESNFDKKTKICIFAGMGNNGADAICVARILTEQDYLVDLYCVCSNHKKSVAFMKELEIAKHFHVNISNRYQDTSYDLILDGIFGIGLNRTVTGIFSDCISYINKSKAVVISLDIPSGLNGDTGVIMGNAVNANYTITFAYKKTGLLLNEGPNLTGILICTNIGISKHALNVNEKYISSYAKCEQPDLPKRKITGNKSTFGKVVIFAGSEEYGGAAILSSLAAYRMGCGMVHIITHSVNKKLLLEKNPEALITCYKEEFQMDLFESIFDWADVIIAGPGIGFHTIAENIFERIIFYISNHQSKPFVMDADALSMLAKNESYLLQLKDCKNIVCTPHVKEFSRLVNTSVIDIKKNMLNLVTDYSKKWNIITVCKDAKTYIYDGSTGESYVNQSGNNGMATAGSGDVLTGMIGALIGQGMNCFEAAYTAVHIHGLAGDLAEIEFGRGLVASDIIKTIKKII